MNRNEEDYFELSHHEDELINHRLTWLIGSQSLLFAGYAVLLAVEKEKVSSIEQWQLALHWLPVLGISISSLILIGIVSAVIASCILKVRFSRATFGVHWATTWGGWLTALLFPVAFIVAWIKVGL